MRTAADRRARGRRRGGRGRRRLRPGAPLRPAARVPVPAPRGDRRQDVPDRDRHCGDRHALREPALHGRGCGSGRRPQRRPTAARNQPRLARAGVARGGRVRLRPSRGHERRRAGATQDASCSGPRSPGQASCTRMPAVDPAPRCFPSSRCRPGCRSGSGGAPGRAGPPRGSAEQGMNLMSSTLLTRGHGVPFDELQAEQIALYRDAWAAAGRDASRVSPSAAASSRSPPTSTAASSAVSANARPGRLPRRRHGPLRATATAASRT